MSLKKWAILFFLLFGSKSFSQGEAAIPFLILPTDPKLMGAGASGTASLTDDPYKFFFNPAHLGFQGKGLNFSAGFYPGEIKWMPDIYDDLMLSSYAFTAGYDFQKTFSNLPLSVGVGYSRSEINFGQLLNEEAWDFVDRGRDYYSSYSFGVGFRSIVNVGFGITLKDITSFLSNRPSSEFGVVKAEGTAIDYGLIISLPVNNLLKKPLGFNLSNTSYINTDINYTLGYTIQNVGDKVYYIDAAQADPLPRTARLAHNLEIGCTLHAENYSIKLINLSYSIDADDILIKRELHVNSYGDTTGQSEYQGMFGNIKPFKNLFLAENDPEIVLHKGLIVEFLDILTLTTGSVTGRGFNHLKTSGIGIRVKGVLKLISLSLKDETLSYIADHFDLQYFNTTYNSGHIAETKLNGLYVTVGGL